jgi:hypothetical protein
MRSRIVSAETEPRRQPIEIYLVGRGVYVRLRPFILLSIWIMLLLPLLGCQSNSDVSESAGPWSHTGKRGVYGLQFGLGWIREDPAVFNTHADLAASQVGELFLIVIPQELPVVRGVPTPDATALKRASVEIMRDSISDFEIVEENPMVLGGVPAETIFARGSVGEVDICYVLTYITNGAWGYQIVGWAPAFKQRTLATRVDEVLRTWTFPDSLKATHRAGAEASTPTTQETPQVRP